MPRSPRSSRHAGAGRFSPTSPISRRSRRPWRAWPTRRDVTDALVTTAVARGHAAEVVSLAAESVAADPLREPAVLSLMRALAATGQPSRRCAPRREYQARLADEAGLDPSPALDDLVRDIAAGAAPPVPREATGRPRPSCSAATRRSERCTGCSGPSGW